MAVAVLAAIRIFLRFQSHVVSHLSLEDTTNILQKIVHQMYTDSLEDMMQTSDQTSQTHH